jgi:cbb3-type cytochrome oxidase maturation protein
MSILYLILPLALMFAAAAVGAFAWTVRSGQLDDVDTPPRRILFDDERSSAHSAAIHQVNSVAQGNAPAVALK